jgi:cobalt-zinc-cadmium resistance protein CzcA
MHWIVERALKAPAAVILLVLVLIGVGVRSFLVLDIEAYPNPVAPMIEVIAQPQGMSAEEVERYVTIPLETQLAGMADLLHIRSQSLFGLSDVKCYFSWNPSFAEANQRVLNRLQFVQLPPGVQAQISPWNAVGEIYRYVLKGRGHSLKDLKAAQDFLLERQFRQVPGVIDVVGFGGETRQYQVEVDPYALRGHGLNLGQLTSALSNANQNVGGQRMTLGEQSYDVRGIGLLRNTEDIGDVVLAAPKGVPVSVHEVAVVKEGAAPRLGIVGRDFEPDIVQGIVLMRYGGNALETLEGVHAKVDAIRKNHLLPPGMEIEPYYDRGTLTRLTTDTVLENLILGMVLVSLVLWIFLGDGRAALVAAVNIPLSLLAAFAGMILTATPANLISLGAVDFGIIVDSTVIVVENIHRHLGHRGRGTLAQRVVKACEEIGQPMLFSTLILVLAFLPLFAMTGVAGVIFSPLARTYAFSIGAAVLLAITLTPVLASKLLSAHQKGAPGLLSRIFPKAEFQGDARAAELLRAAHGAGHSESDDEESPAMRSLRGLYQPLFAFAVKKPGLAMVIACLPVLVAFGAGPLLGGEFMPKLEEGNFWIRATLPLSISLEQSSKYVGKMRRIVLGCPVEEHAPCDKRGRPEVRTVVSQLGRPDDGTDPSGFYNIELFAPLLPRNEWRKGVTKELLTEQLSKELQDAFPGFSFNFSQYIADNVEEALSGVKGENTVKVVGPDVKVNEAMAKKVVEALSKVRGIEDLGLYESLGQPDVQVTPDRKLCRRHGLNVGDVESVLQAAVGGQAVTQVFQGEMRFDLVVRWKPEYRADLRKLQEILIPTPDGAQVPLGQLAKVETVEGPARIWREDSSRYAPVKFSVRGRDLTSTIDEAKAVVAGKVTPPWDTHFDWAGELDELREAKERMLIVVPMTLLIIAFLVWTAVKGLRPTAVVLAGLPVACSGGVFALFLTGTPLSVSSAMGFVSIFGIAVQDALLVVTAAQRLWAGGAGLEEGAQQAAERGLRPVLMTAMVALIGLLPAALSRGIGSETQRPLALVVIGGSLAMMILPRLLQPALLVLLHRGAPQVPAPEEPLAAETAAPEPAHSA